MSKLFVGKVKVDDQVTEFDMSELAEGKLTLPTGAVKNISEISDTVKVGVGAPQEGGEKLVQEKHLVAAKNEVQGNINQVAGDLAAETQNRIDGDSALSGALDAEVARATGEEGRIEGKHDAYVTSNNAALAQEVSDRVAGDSTLQGNIDALSGAVAADFSALETDMVAALGAEEAARIAADGVLQGNIDAEKARIDAMLSGSSVDFDTLKEIVDAYQLADTDIVDSITSLSGALVQEVADRIADVDAEETRALAAEALLQTNINNEAAARTAADSAATTDRAAIRSEFAAADLAEQTARIAADNTLQGNIDAEAASRTSADAALQAELDASQAGSGLEANGNYVAPNPSNYISTASSLKDADVKLDAAIKVNADGLAAEIVNRSNADATLQTNINNEQTARIAGDNTLQGNIDALSGAVAADFASLETDFQAALTAEETARIAGDSALSSSLAAEVIRAQGEEGRIEGLVTSLSGAVASDFASLEADMLAAVATVQADVDQNEADADAAILAEQTARIAGDDTLQTNINNLSGAVAADFAAMETAYQAADASLQAQINDILSNTDAAALDSLTEIVAAFQAADADLTTSITNVLGTHTSELNAFSGAVAADFASLEADMIAAVSAEETARIAGDAALSSSLAAEIARAEGVETALSGAIEDEEARALAAEAVLAAAISSEEAARIAGDNTLQGNIDALSGAVAADFASLETDFQTALSAEVASLEAADLALSGALDAEIVRAQGEEARIEGKFDAHFDGFVKVAYLTEADSVMGIATHYIVNASAPKGFTIPTMTEDYFIMVKVAEGSEPVTMTAGAGESIDGEVDGNIVMYGGTSVMFVKKGGVMYMF